jgi:hypothetical protein
LPGLLSEIVIGDSGFDGVQALEVPRFVIGIIERRLSVDCIRANSFVEISKILREHCFEIVAGVDSEEVFGFSDWVELPEKSMW